MQAWLGEHEPMLIFCGYKYTHFKESTIISAILTDFSKAMKSSVSLSHNFKLKDIFSVNTLFHNEKEQHKKQDPKQNVQRQKYVSWKTEG